MPAFAWAGCDLQEGLQEGLNVRHELKTWPKEFHAVVDGVKTAEFRWDDRGFAVGDTLLLCEWDTKTDKYTGRQECVVVTHLVFGNKFGIPSGYVMMSIRRLQG
jgi:hypothetical protein